MYRQDEKEVRALKIRLQNRVIEYHDWQTCLNCDHYRKGDGVCTAFKAAPPPAVLVVGCEAWLPEVPF